MQPTQHILILRFSAMGDVAMTVPVLKALLVQYPQLEVTMLSNQKLAPFFSDIPRCYFSPVYLKAQHKGVVGLWRLYKELLKGKKFDAIADLHNVLRTTILRKYFLLSGIKNAVIDKGRAHKKKLTKRTHKELVQLPTSHQRYAAVFEQLGFPIDFSKATILLNRKPTIQLFFDQLDTSKILVGIAPFAQHAQKMLPLHQMKMLVAELASRKNLQLLFFGGGEAEATVLEEWQQTYPGTFNIAEKYTFQEELHILQQLKVMVSMDSANMHIASMYSIPVVSIWGATHPFAGFYGWKQDPENIVQLSLECRPCSIFGNKICYRGDFACMSGINTEMILQKLEPYLKTF
ncbi:MAG: glycosyltransferase family 9 protein [Ferruginibacter sp.]